MDKKILLPLIGIGALFLLTGNQPSSGSNGYGSGCAQKFRLPNGNVVCEDDLPAMGYIFTNGGWYPANNFQPSGQYAGTNPNSPQWLQILLNLTQTGVEIFSMFQGNQNNNIDPLDQQNTSEVFNGGDGGYGGYV